MWGPKKEAEAAPPALGEEATPSQSPLRASRSESRDLLCILVSFPSTKKWAGDFQQRPAQLAGAVSACPVQAAGRASPGRAPRDPPPGRGSFLPREPLLPPSRVGTHCALAEPAFDSSPQKCHLPTFCFQNGKLRLRKAKLSAQSHTART